MRSFVSANDLQSTLVAAVASSVDTLNILSCGMYSASGPEYFSPFSARSFFAFAISALMPTITMLSSGTNLKPGCAAPNDTTPVPMSDSLTLGKCVLTCDLNGESWHLKTRNGGENVESVFARNSAMYMPVSVMCVLYLVPRQCSA